MIYLKYFEVYWGDLSRKCLNACELHFLEWGLRKNILNISYWLNLLCIR